MNGIGKGQEGPLSYPPLKIMAGDKIPYNSIPQTGWLLLVSGGRCTYCQIKLDKLEEMQITIDHIIPRSWGGPTNELYNKVIACTWCNSTKSKLEKDGAHKYILDYKVHRFIRQANKLAKRERKLRFSTMYQNMAYQVRESYLVHLWEKELHREERLHFRQNNFSAGGE